MKPTVCVRCQVEMKVDQIGVVVIECAKVLNQHAYRIWHADLEKCPLCETEIISRFADRPFAEHFQPDFSEKLHAALKNKNNRIIYNHER